MTRQLEEMSLDLLLRPRVKKILPRRIRYWLAANWYSHDLDKLAWVFDTDKWKVHRYTPRYATYFWPLRFKKLKIVEIGVGGYTDPRTGGNSLRMWKAYFPNSQIYGIDVYDKRALEEERIAIFQGDQTDAEFLKGVVKKIGVPDIIIDDGSHINAHVIRTFEVMFPLMSERGIYVVEDTQTSYWPQYGGDSTDLNAPSTSMGYFKSLINGLNHHELIHREGAPSYFDRHIVSIHFYRNLLFVFKGDNAKPIELGEIK